jgi:hypothetical protein
MPVHIQAELPQIELAQPSSRMQDKAMNDHNPQTFMQSLIGDCLVQEQLNLAIAVLVEALQVESAPSIEERQDFMPDLTIDEAQSWLPEAKRVVDMMVLFEFDQCGH